MWCLQLVAEWGLEPLEGKAPGGPFTEEELQLAFAVEGKTDDIMLRRTILLVSIAQFPVGALVQENVLDRVDESTALSYSLRM